MHQFPLTVRRSIEMVGLLSLGYAFVVGRSVIMPLLMAFFLSLLLLPVYRWLRKRRLPEVIAIVLSIIGMLVVVAGIFIFFFWQVGNLLSDFPTIQKNLMLHWGSLSGWISQKLHYSYQQQIALLTRQLQGASEGLVGYLQGAAISLSSVLIFVGLLPIYIFLILFYKNLLVRFAFMWFEESEHQQVEAALRETETIVKYYLLGLLIQMGYLTILVGGGLALFGIKHAILIGAVFAVLNLIPYIGALIGNIIGVLLTLSSSQEMWQIWVVLGTIAVVQFLDNNILMPRIVGSQVKVNALASILSIILGGTLAGVSGMFLSIPILAVLKIIFDKTRHLRQWGVLIGDSRPNISPISARIFRIRKQLEQKRNEEVNEEVAEKKNDI